MPAFLLPLLAQAAGPVIGALLDSDDKDTASTAADIALTVAQTVTGLTEPKAALHALDSDPAAAVKYRAQLRKETAELAAQETKRLAAVNKTMRAEIASGDKYIARARPTMLYVAALSTIALVGGVVFIGLYTIFKDLDMTSQVLLALAELIAATLPLFTFMGAVCGVYVWKRSTDKATAAGHAPQPSVLGAIAQKIASK